ncbi:MAG: competence/damage-inducible protein A [Candidatus Hatepunaea meridiana]|nr:competence/damage-inducible protein A [Candidatus Hatepunaea meridiana]
MKIELITIGDEILLGHTQDTNSNWIASQLSEYGFHLRWVSIVGDNPSDMKHQLRRAWDRADVILVTGGLGPTHDDITRPVIAKFFNDDLVLRDDLSEWIQSKFTAREIDPPPGYEVMAEFPSHAIPILNEYGSAPGIHYNLDDRELFAMPGVPIEMRGMFTNYVLPELKKKTTEYYKHRILKTAGIGEAYLSELIGDPAKIAPVTLAYLPSIDHGVTLRLSLSGKDAKEIDTILKQAEGYIQSSISEYIYATDQISLEKVILDMLESKGMKLAVAESCTGGLMASRLVAIPGSSNSFDRGYVTYSNEAKIASLSVSEELLESCGAVSAEVAVAMAEGTVECAGVDIAVSVTGIAGPTGGTEEKPVGLVYIAVADQKGGAIQQFRFDGDRNTNRRRSAQAALVMLWQKLKGYE